MTASSFQIAENGRGDKGRRAKHNEHPADAVKEL
jgi:hypothetical protein